MKEEINGGKTNERKKSEQIENDLRKKMEKPGKEKKKKSINMQIQLGLQLASSNEVY